MREKIAALRRLPLRRQLEQVAKALEKNNMTPYIVNSREEVVPLVRSLLDEGCTVACGGSMTLEECGVQELLRSGAYRYLDRAAADPAPESMRRLFVDSLNADVYLCSANAVTLRGELYNVDGNANRIAALCYGPRSVILVVGCNKLVRDIAAAETRVKRMAAPANAMRLGCKTYCASFGVCKGVDGCMTDGCESDARICCSYLVQAKQRIKGRIKVILVGEELGL